MFLAWHYFSSNILLMTSVIYKWPCAIQIHKGFGGHKKASQGSSSRDKDIQAEIGESSDFERCCI